jgi:hypothetical protein
MNAQTRPVMRTHYIFEKALLGSAVKLYTNEGRFLDFFDILPERAGNADQRPEQQTTERRARNKQKTLEECDAIKAHRAECCQTKTYADKGADAATFDRAPEFL